MSVLMTVCAAFFRFYKISDALMLRLNIKILFCVIWKYKTHTCAQRHPSTVTVTSPYTDDLATLTANSYNTTTLSFVIELNAQNISE